MTFRPLSPELTQALDAYQRENFLPSRNAAINQLLSRALLGGQAPALVAPKQTQPIPPAPVNPPVTPVPQSLGGWN